MLPSTVGPARHVAPCRLASSAGGSSSVHNAVRTQPGRSCCSSQLWLSDSVTPRCLPLDFQFQTPAPGQHRQATPTLILSHLLQPRLRCSNCVIVCFPWLLCNLQEDASSSGFNFKYVSHVYSDGADCVLTGAPRTAEVRPPVLVTITVAVTATWFKPCLITP